MASVIQTMDQGIIKTLKHFCIRLLVESILIGDFDSKKLNILHASRMCKKAWDKVSLRMIMKCFHKAGFVKKKTEGVNVVENFDEIDPELAVDNWEDVHSDPSILYEDYVNVDQNVVVCDESTDADIIARLAVNSQAENGLSGDEEDKEIQEKPLPSTSEAMVHIHELRRFFEGQSNVEDSIFVSIDRLESYAMTQRLHLYWG
ncbi:hypothetical protein AVEN_45096-1 [Araneus ventricosus]|uniref:DDE-1 domain-containing protein n=1 Tax=Araneus ventricosus TaxID=182803 RepID=A0A4Y2RTF1_ARAVE|nr:hypothetical protein AVEN_45096-1 [Araneus ventricosus]